MLLQFSIVFIVLGMNFATYNQVYLIDKYGFYILKIRG